MDVFVVVALIGVALLLAELLLPTGGVLAVLGALGLVAGGILALTADADAPASDWLGPALITLGILSVGTFYFVTRKVYEAQREEGVRTGSEELVGTSAEARTTLDPEGQVWIDGALWRARLTSDAAAARPGDRVVIEAVEGLTLVVRPQSPTAQAAEEGAS
jgi:membrane-bound serine protease (ClpP class)